MKKISVIVPVYKVEEFLPQCLDSILAQTLTEMEIICVNDGSPDNSLKILEEYAKKDDRIVIINQKNGGLSSARNTGIKSATGEYIGFVDSDDWIEPDFYHNLYQAAKEHNADIVGTGFYSVKNNKKKISYFVTETKTALTPEDKFKIFKMPKNNFVWNKIYKKDMICSQDLFFPIGMNYEDIIWSSQVMELSQKAVMIPSVGYNYRYNICSIVHTTYADSKKLLDQTQAHKFQRSIMEKYKMKIKPNWDITIKIKLFGITIIKIYEAYNYKKIIYCFGIKLFEIRTIKKR